MLRIKIIKSESIKCDSLFRFMNAAAESNLDACNFVLENL